MKSLLSNIQCSFVKHRLHFKQQARTSRGAYSVRDVWYVTVRPENDRNRWGIGECAPLPDLSCDALPNYEQILTDACHHLEQQGHLDTERLRPYPSILFGLETAIRHLEAGSFALWDTPFSRGEAGIPINGLIWMSDYADMLKQIETKLSAGFRCIKLKIGAIDFEEEMTLLRHIRNHFPAKDLELRVDANGAFTPKEAPGKLNRLTELDIHSIEQPIRAGQWEAMAQLIAKTSLPVALDEELIGVHSLEEKRRLLNVIHPRYIILKPSLHGGFCGCDEWIEEAEKLNIGRWMTSALESNIGLNAIAQKCATFNNPLPQGLGTGQLFHDNIDLPLFIRKDCLWFEKSLEHHCEGDSPKQSTSKSSKGDFSPPSGRQGGGLLHSVRKDDNLQTFLSEWYNESPVMTVQTSGSTGMPKSIVVEKKKMINSAQMTCSFLNLKKGDKSLLCLPPEYIAGQMMVVRALTAGLDLIVRDPSGNPLADVDTPLRFAAMTPMQVYNSLQVPEEKERLMQIEILLIGGGAIDSDLNRILKTLPNVIYSTYGMTETLSHIALRRLNGAEASDYYMPFPSVKLSLSPEKTLIIEAFQVADEIIYTNDIAELLPDGRFRILGRRDNIINSGGIKIQAETVEEALRSGISGDFAVTSVPHPKFGEAVVLLLSKKQTVSSEQINTLLPTYQRPKYVQITETIPLTPNGKIDRKACRELAMKHFPK